MINIDYINGSVNLESDIINKSIDSFNESCKNDIDNIFSNFNIIEEKIALESEIMGVIPEKMSIIYESEKKGIFTRIGEMVIAIYNKFVEIIDNIIDKVKTYTFKKKSDLQKLDILLKKHPDLKNEAIAAFNAGALDLSDVRSLKELDSTFDEILKLARKQDIDPKTLRGKWEKVKEKFDKDYKELTVVKVAGIATTVITAALALKTFTDKCVTASNHAQKEKQTARETKAEILARLKEEGAVTNDMGKWQTVLQIWRELNGKHLAVRNAEYSTLTKISNGIASFLDRFDRKGGIELQYNLEKTKNLKDKKDSDSKNEKDKK